MAGRVSNALNNVVNCLPDQRVVENAIEDIANASQVLAEPNIKVWTSVKSKSAFSLNVLGKNLLKITS